MGSVGLPEILVIGLVVLLLFGAGRIADIGKGLGQGIKNFKQGLKEADDLDADKKSSSGSDASQGGSATAKKADGDAAVKQA